MKKFVALILTITLLSTVCFASASAGSLFGKVSETKKAVAAETVVKGANALIDLTVKIAQTTKKDDGQKAKVATDIIAGTTKLFAGLLGTEVGCEMTQETIDNKVYDIDPLIVINPKVGKKK